MISLVIPVHNEEDNLPELYRRISEVVTNWQEGYEVISVDDGSSDGTPQLLSTIHERDPRWKIVRFSRNFGHQAAVTAGLTYATGDVIIVMDADLQDPPELLPVLLQKLREGYQVVYGIRRKRKEPVFKRIAYYAFYRLLAFLATVDIPLDAGDFCAMDRQVVQSLNALPERVRFVRGLRTWVGFRQTGIEYERNERFGGKPKYTLARLVRLAMDGLFNFSYQPLHLITLTGTGLSVGSFLLGCVIVLQRVANFSIFGMLPQDVPGWTSTILLVLFLFGMQFIAMGVIAEYIGRIFREVKGRPAYIVAKSIGFDD